MNAATIPTDLNALRLPELWALYGELLGEETRCPNKTFLIRKIREAGENGQPQPEAEEAQSAEHVEEVVEQSDSALEQNEPETPGDDSSSAQELEPSQDETQQPEWLPSQEETDALDDQEQQRENETSVDPAEAEPSETGEAPEEPSAKMKLTKLTVAELRALYLEVVQRPTKSHHKAYLIWKIREARKGRVPVGPTRGAGQREVPHKVLPLRMPETSVEALDEAWRRHGLKSRMDLFRQALNHYLTFIGENEAADLFLTNETQGA